MRSFNSVRPLVDHATKEPAHGEASCSRSLAGTPKWGLEEPGKTEGLSQPLDHPHVTWNPKKKTRCFWAKMFYVVLISITASSSNVGEIWWSHTWRKPRNPVTTSTSWHMEVSINSGQRFFFTLSHRHPPCQGDLKLAYTKYGYLAHSGWAFQLFKPRVFRSTTLQKPPFFQFTQGNQRQELGFLIALIPEFGCLFVGEPRFFLGLYEQSSNFTILPIGFPMRLRWLRSLFFPWFGFGLSWFFVIAIVVMTIGILFTISIHSFRSQDRRDILRMKWEWLRRVALHLFQRVQNLGMMNSYT